jgi:hypothetical protein
MLSLHGEKLAFDHLPILPEKVSGQAVAASLAEHHNKSFL